MLYIEDNLSNLELIQKLLATRPEIKLLSAMQGRLGLDLARHHQPDLILLDLHLPDLGGEAVLLQLKAEPALRDIPVIMLSADASQNQIERLRASGAHAYLTKPLNLKQLLALLSETLA
jgi:CheY-like chemotaxis protein